METDALHKRLLSIGEKIRARGWLTASVDIYVSYLAIFDREPSSLDPIIYCRPSIRASTKDKYASPTTHEFVRDGSDCKTLEQALMVLEKSAESMPEMTDEIARVANAKEKLSEDERRLLGIR